MALINVTEVVLFLKGRKLTNQSDFSSLQINSFFGVVRVNSLPIFPKTS